MLQSNDEQIEIFNENEALNVDFKEQTRDQKQSTKTTNINKFQFIESLKFWIIIFLVIFLIGILINQIRNQQLIGQNPKEQIRKPILIELDIQKNSKEENKQNYFSEDKIQDKDISYQKNYTKWQSKLIKKFIETLYKEFPKEIKQNLSPDDKYQYTGLTYRQMARAAMYRHLVEHPQDAELAKLEYQYYDRKYSISKYNNEKPFCIVVTSYNNAAEQRYKRNLLSIFQQNYTIYHVVYYDDASPDKTGQFVKKFLEKHPLKQKVKLLINTINKSSLENLVDAARNHCKPQDIFFRVDGDDEIIGKQVLRFFNTLYQNRNIWNIYTNSIEGNYTIGLSRPFSKKTIKNNNYRYAPFSFFHQTSFYNELMLRIKDEHMRDKNGQFFRAASDNTILTPIYEMCHHRLKYIPEVTYFYNSDTGVNEYQRKNEEQRRVGKYIVSLPKYESLKSLF